MNADHFAIVIGLSRYPRLADPPPDLHGPENDADAVCAWLTDPSGGALPETNIRLVRSGAFGAPPTGAPTRDQLEEAFLWLDGLAKRNQENGKGRVVGRRLYLYAAGHGFSPRFRQGCLLAGNAAEEQYSANVFPSAWIEWLQDAGYFRECVLWLDCCMDRQVLTQPTPPPLTPISGGTAPGPTFIAFAASRPLKAVEKPIPEDGNKWHGIFTWNLLQGLRGAASNQAGRVTGHLLADWLRQAQLSWLDDADRRNPDTAKEPAIIDEDDALVFARNVPAVQFKVVLRFANSLSGQKARLWSGVPARPADWFSIEPSGTTVNVVAGLYVVDVPAATLRHGFAVTRDLEVTVSETGDPPEVKTQEKFRLSVHPNDETSEIRVVGQGDSAFSLAESSTGRLDSQLPAGVYQIRIQIGRQIVEKIVLLDSDWPKPAPAPQARSANTLPELPQITSAAPLPLTRATHEYQQGAAADQRPFDVTIGAGAELMVMARGFSESGEADPNAQPWNGVSVLDLAGNVIADLSTTGWHQTNKDPVAVCKIALQPGAYVLKYSVDDTTSVAQSLFVPPNNWRMEAYLLSNLDSRDPGRRLRISLLMRKIGRPWGTWEDVYFEKARVALADERPILNDQLTELLFRKFENPLAGIVGAHLLLLSHEQGKETELSLLNAVVRNLRVLVGNQHPDVEALSFCCPDLALRSTVTVTAPPIFERSWRILVGASQETPTVISTELWGLVHAQIPAPPFLAWTPDSVRQAGFRAAMAAAIFERPLVEETPQPGAVILSLDELETRSGATLESLGIEGGATGSVGASDRRRPARRATAEAFGLPPWALDMLEHEYRGDK